MGKIKYYFLLKQKSYKKHPRKSHARESKKKHQSCFDLYTIAYIEGNE